MELGGRFEKAHNMRLITGAGLEQIFGSSRLVGIPFLDDSVIGSESPPADSHSFRQGDVTRLERRKRHIQALRTRRTRLRIADDTTRSP